MRTTISRPRRASLALAAAAALAVLVATGGSAQAATAIGLGTADSYVVLAGAGVTNTGPTTLGGDLGSAPDGSVTGAADITFSSGTNYADGGPTAGAKLDLVTAYDNAAGQGPTIPIVADLAGLTLVPGVYTSASTILLTGALTLDAQGDPNAVWVFQAGSGLDVVSGASVTVTNGAQACNVFWQVGSTATLGTGVDFVGTVMALTSITLDTGATVDGRVLARNGSVTLDTNTITRPVCAAAPPVTPPATPPAAPAAPGDQVTAVPSGGVATGDGSTSLSTDAGATWLIAGAGVVVMGATAALAARRRRNA